MTRAEYDRTRKLPERKRATLNGKRSIDAFIKSIHDRMAAEYPDKVQRFDDDIVARIGILHFYFAKYIMARWNPKGARVFTVARLADKSVYIDNNFDDDDQSEREFMIQFFKELT